ncbi:class I SAM-dependent methyltransferase [Streptococcus equi subsp. zooepidemicus]|uniref:DNA N-4 cytosine methyltransferase M.NgoMXV n=2 Tax=Streptococcus equi TaxID=1336 RepID=A0AAJ1USR6_STRSZ|nr:class I SAM-dependent methyltransferase [Streptococcus equi]KIQ76100.1 methyltransferase [Streptococcus equi subsp. zooepidemicus]MCD3390872.1 class I SAM-dependent methyltransferase [Streptococcus equi subsp. zooepidemicus]MCD3417788.1 class I SAM-dependent methyltransferase [Streptococcus equi subsp. zooepidemicus]MCD3422899.1 class I SAM-dependent methyltransferase [Streptococcus equi subsp. zooepidemicus]MCD3433957.1 class I SAM-dependent methyltransferase [Streptococcus equi subsp. zoo
MTDIKILDACCGSRLFWFDKNEPHTTFMDVRQEKFEMHGKKINVNPDVIGDFRDMPFESNSFNLAVFDPPHLKYVGQNSIMKAQYGQLDKENWKEDISKGFEECIRVLKVGGTLIFKWSDCQVNVREVLSAIPFKPLFGQQRGTTHWMTFVKFDELTGNGG